MLTSDATPSPIASIAERATARAFYDAQVLVVGAGPAGLAAALRARWVKGYHALSASVVVFDAGSPGGLLRWGGCVLTGPAWAYSGETLNQKLLEDIEKWRVPIVRQRVMRLEATDDGGFAVRLASGERWTGRTVILAGGFRPVGADEADYQRGVRITFKGYEHFPALLTASAKDAAGQGLLVVGNAQTLKMQALLKNVSTQAGGLSFLLEGQADEDFRRARASLASLGDVVEGQLERVVYAREAPDADIAGTDRVVGASILHPDGRVSVLRCGAILLDYNAFELSPVSRLQGLWPPCDARGFVQVDALMQTGTPGIFAAGDITGRYAATLVALGDGVTAGFSAYRYAFRQVFQREPHLFAYRASDESLAAEPQDLPTLPDDAVPILVGDATRIRSKGPVGPLLDEQTSVGSLRRQLGAPVVNATLFALMEQKDIAIHRPPGHPPVAAGGTFESQ